MEMQSRRILNLFFDRACSDASQWGVEIRFPPGGKSLPALKPDRGQKHGDAVAMNVEFILIASYAFVRKKERKEDSAKQANKLDSMWFVDSPL